MVKGFKFSKKKPAGDQPVQINTSGVDLSKRLPKPLSEKRFNNLQRIFRN